MLPFNIHSPRYVRFVAVSIPFLILLYVLFLSWDPSPTQFNDHVTGAPRTGVAPEADQALGLAEPPENPSSEKIESNTAKVESNTAKSESSPIAGGDIGTRRTAIFGITDKIWQSAKDNNLTDNQHEWIDSWVVKNPYFRHELLTDFSSETFVRTHYSSTRPDIVEVYENLPIPILRADLLRYLIVLAEGGIWSDLDVTCDKPVADWVPAEYKAETIDMIVGLEFDFEWRGEGTQVASQFCNWVFAARPSSRNLRVVVDAVVKKLKEIAFLNGVEIGGLTLEMLPIDVVDVTGPKIMTIAILESLRRLLDRTVDDRDFSGIKRPKLIGDVLIMPGNAFAAAQNGWPKDQGDTLVTHHYAGSWKQADAEAKEKKKQQQNGKGDA